MFTVCGASESPAGILYYTASPYGVKLRDMESRGTIGGDMNAAEAPGATRERSVMRVVISAHLRDYTGGRSEIEIEGASDVAALIRLLGEHFPGIQYRLLDDQGNVRRYVNIFADEDDIREKDGIFTPLRGVREVVILPSVAGG